MENPIKVDDLGVSLFSKTSKCNILTSSVNVFSGNPKTHACEFPYPCSLPPVMGTVENGLTKTKTKQVSCKSKPVIFHWLP